MFKHLLLPTDGSDASESAVQQGVRLAKEIGARVTGVHVMPRYHLFTYQTEMLEDTKEQFAKDCEAYAKKCLAAVESAARQANVPCETIAVAGDHPHEAIIQATRERQCDLIVMATHGTRGLEGLIVGSETQKVLSHSQVPVLVL